MQNKPERVAVAVLTTPPGRNLQELQRQSSPAGGL